MGKPALLPKSAACVLTGASSGIGRALALKLAAKYKARLVINARKEESLLEVKDKIEKAGGSAIICAGDVADPGVPQRAVAECIEKFGCIDALINNAGLAVPGPLTKLSVEDWKHVFDVNVFAPLTATYAAMPSMRAAGKGLIVNVSSVAGKISLPGMVCYSASKFALTGMSEGMSAELIRDGIHVLTVYPGWIRTEFFEKNSMPAGKNPTAIAQNQDLAGLLMRHCLSISSEECAAEIIDAIEKHLTQIVITNPGVLADKVSRHFPSVLRVAARKLPMRYFDASSEHKS